MSNNYKERVKRLKNAIFAVLKAECTQSQAYEIMAKEDNYPNWDAMSGSINKNQEQFDNSNISFTKPVLWSNVSGSNKIDSLNLTIKEPTVSNWTSVSGFGKPEFNKSKSFNLTTKEQITQLFIVHEGLRNCCTFYDLLQFLKTQSNPVVKEGWSNVNFECASNNIVDVFVQTKFFHEDVLTILKLSSMTGNLESSVYSAIQYLKTI